MNGSIVTIIIATKNSENTLVRCLKSINDQNCRENVQVIIKDAKSEDNTVDIAKKYLSQSDDIITKKDSGIYDAWNQALNRVKGRWILFLGSDDYLFDSNSILNTIPYLLKANNDGIKICYGNVILKNGMNVVERLGKEWSELRENITKIMNLPHTGVFHDSSLFKDLGKFDSSFRIAGDYEFLLRYFKKGSEALYMKDVVVTVMSDDGISGGMGHRFEMFEETKKAREVNGIKTISVPLVLWSIRLRLLYILKIVLPQKLINYCADLYRLIIGKSRRWTYK